MGSEKSMAGETADRAAATFFARAAEADRRIAGVSAAGRMVKALTDAGSREVRLAIGEGAPLARATQQDVERLRGSARVRILSDAAGPRSRPATLPSAWQIVRSTAKPGDGLVSRWLNRPISQRITWLLLRVPGARPLHVTVFNGLLALVMVAALLLGGEAGLILGGLLFHAASVLDGVDGEMARASYRMSAAGAALDSAIDMATNLLFLAAFTAHLALRDGAEAGWVGGWGLGLGTVGALLIASRVRADGAPLGFDLLKRRGRVRGLAGLLFWIVQTLSSRDCFAFLFMVLILAGLEWTALWLFSGITTLWFLYVLASLTHLPRVFRGAA